MFHVINNMLWLFIKKKKKKNCPNEAHKKKVNISEGIITLCLYFVFVRTLSPYLLEVYVQCMKTGLQIIAGYVTCVVIHKLLYSSHFFFFFF